MAKNPLTSLRKKCDKELQIKGRELYDSCEICGKPISCLHHFFPKSVSANLRYDWDNLIPICQGCHMRHHQAGDPKIHATVIEKRGGLKWYNDLAKRSRELIRINQGYYKGVLEDISETQ